MVTLGKMRTSTMPLKIVLLIIIPFGWLFMACGGGDNNPEMETPETELDSQDLEGPLAEGCPDTVYDDWKTSDYVLPYPVGPGYVVSLSNCSGSFHSEGEPDQYAVDFSMSIGTLITAARAGRVVYVEESGEDGGFPNNKVVVKHDDGTFGQYMHLTKDGALVVENQEVVQGSEIGLSGNTGLAGSPHLHFVVTAAGNFNFPYESLPVTFKNTKSNERSLATGHRYPAFEY